MKRDGTMSQDLRDRLVGIVHNRTDLSLSAAIGLVEALEPTIASVDENAHARGQTDVEPWVVTVRQVRPVDQGPTVLALARALELDESTPPALRAIAADFRRSRVADRPRARSTDPGTSQRAADKVQIRRAGGKVHRILDAYARHRRQLLGDGRTMLSDSWARAFPQGMTAREVEERFGIPEAHKRTSDLLRDGLLETIPVEVTLGDGRVVTAPLERDGGRVLRLTLFGRQELDRMAEIQPMIAVEE